uniref:Proteasome subunit beta n=1 Tax=Schistocephalus solidus TaxID=70667 RepID=A0A183TJW8_SCHSO
LADSKKHTLSPSASGASVIGIKYKDGVIIAADVLVSYGSLARYTNFDRVAKVNDKTVLGCSGDVADFQLLLRYIQQQTLLDNLLNDALHSWITRVMYNRRSQFNPLWNTYIVGGVSNDNKPFLGYTFTENCVATGFGAYLVAPTLRRFLDAKANGDPDQLSYEDALTAIKESLLMLYYRDCRSETYAI